MIDVLLIGGKNATLTELSRLLNLQEGVAVTEVSSEEKAMEIASRNEHQLVIVDEKTNKNSGIEFTKQLIATNPLLNCAIVSSLGEEDFHESTEGLGVLSSIPKTPAPEDVERLLTLLKRILGLLK